MIDPVRGAEIDDAVDDDQAATIALRKFLKAVADTETIDDYDETDAGMVETAAYAARSVQELRRENEQLRRQVNEHGRRLDVFADVGAEPSNKEEKIVAVLAFADNARGPDQDRVVVKPADVKGATGCSRRYAYDLLDDMVHGDSENGTVGPDGYSWASDNTERRDRTTGLGGAESETPPKGAVVDFDELVHSDDRVVNLFNTRSEGTEGSA
jgi:hypothetical protein